MLMTSGRISCYNNLTLLLDYHFSISSITRQLLYYKFKIEISTTF